MLNSHRGPSPRSPKAQLTGNLPDLQPSLASLESPASGVSLIEEYSMQRGPPNPISGTDAAIPTQPKTSISPAKSAPAKSAFLAEAIAGAAAASPSAESVPEALGLDRRPLSARSVSFRESPSRAQIGSLMHSPSRKDSGGLPTHRSILRRDSMKAVPRSGFEEPEPHKQVS